ncbi:hypothetical protein BDZ94DRAFT_1260701 [Collybia nuda]|uniref:Uncharacterized protein n=1 Tax=Collybia nuda TaxID=64659 RepID=A0A9P6CED7_9AGAR|nr:hypothetical protein BDZ94DRAFT_1260701 [Collybia nuda]
MPRRTLPSFSLAVSSRRDSFTLPDYYRRTRVETYGPYYRQSAPDLMKTIDLRGRESIEYDQSFLLPDIFEDEEIEIIDTKSIRLDHGCATGQGQCEDVEVKQQPKRLRWLWRLFLSLLCKYRGRKVHSVKNVGVDPHLDLSN